VWRAERRQSPGGKRGRPAALARALNLRRIDLRTSGDNRRVAASHAWAHGEWRLLHAVFRVAPTVVPKVQHCPNRLLHRGSSSCLEMRRR
jgi:hypothetical protein